jgi:hypothetical protein
VGLKVFLKLALTLYKKCSYANYANRINWHQYWPLGAMNDQRNIGTKKFKSATKSPILETLQITRARVLQKLLIHWHCEMIKIATANSCANTMHQLYSCV